MLEIFLEGATEYFRYLYTCMHTYIHTCVHTYTCMHALHACMHYMFTCRDTNIIFDPNIILQKMNLTELMNHSMSGNCCLIDRCQSTDNQVFYTISKWFLLYGILCRTSLPNGLLPWFGLDAGEEDLAGNGKQMAEDVSRHLNCQRIKLQDNTLFLGMQVFEYLYSTIA